MSLLELLILIVVLMWLCGWIFFPFGGLIHLLLIVVFVLVLVRVLQGRTVI